MSFDIQQIKFDANTDYNHNQQDCFTHISLHMLLNDEWLYNAVYYFS